ncbi:HAD-like domain-containing protein [Aspergillus pseudodeflectus]|uniref:HAD-like domain-containing protein n=1 Tax=Aspergillus pseudodeflectus TaxID=176178 RepID=A0ABR4JP60_9EURO
MRDQLPYWKGNGRMIFFTDFDGTITLQDSNDYLVDNYGFGRQKREVLELQLLQGKITFREAFKTMLDSVQLPFDMCLEALKENIEFDSHFTAFYHWAKEHEVPIVVLSSGMAPIIQALLEKLLGGKPENIYVVANDIEPRRGEEKGCDYIMKRDWEISFRDNSHFGHDKSLAIRPYSELPSQDRPILLYAGDGVSDLSAASKTDILFAKSGMGLVEYCEREGIPFAPFGTWASVLNAVQAIYEAGSTEDLYNVAATGAG